MIKLMAILRTVVLVGLVLFTLWSLPLGVIFSGTGTREATSFKIEVLERVASATWAAIAWIAVETVLGWVRVGWDGRRQRKELEARLAGAPPPPRP